MTWSDLEPALPAKQETPITVSGTLGRGNAHPRLLISIRPGLIADCPDWLKQAGKIGAMIGQGEHAGLVRLTPTGKHVYAQCTVGIKGAVQVFHLKLRGVPGIRQFKPRVVDFDHAPTWLEITLPKSDPLQSLRPSPAPHPPSVSPSVSHSQTAQKGHSMLGGTLGVRR